MKLRVPFEIFIWILNIKEFHREDIIQNIHPLALADQTIFPDSFDVSFVPYLK